MHLTRRHLAALGRPGVHHDLHNLVELEPLVRRHLRQRVEEVVVRELALALELGLGENQIDGDVGEFRIQQPGAGDELRKRRAVHLLQSHLPLPVGAVLDEQLLERLVALVLAVHLGLGFRGSALSGLLDVHVENCKLVKAHDAVAVGVHAAEVVLDDVRNLFVFQPLEHLQARQEGGGFVRHELLLSVGAALIKELANEHLVTGRLDHALGHRHLTNRVDRVLQLPALHVVLRRRLLHQRRLGVLRLLGQTDGRFRGRRIRVVFFVVGILEIVVTGVTGIGLGLGRVARLHRLVVLESVVRRVTRGLGLFSLRRGFFSHRLRRLFGAGLFLRSRGHVVWHREGLRCRLHRSRHGPRALGNGNVRDRAKDRSVGKLCGSPLEGKFARGGHVGEGAEELGVLHALRHGLARLGEQDRGGARVDLHVHEARLAHGADELRRAHLLRVLLAAVLQVDLPDDLILPVLAERVGDVLGQARLGLEVRELVHEGAELVVADAAVAVAVRVGVRLVQHRRGLLRLQPVEYADVGEQADQLAFVDRAAVVLVVVREQVHDGLTRDVRLARAATRASRLLVSRLVRRRRNLLVPLGKVLLVNLIKVLLVHLDLLVQPVQRHVVHLSLLVDVPVRRGLLELHLLQELDGL